jgi:hypothetical protein
MITFSNYSQNRKKRIQLLLGLSISLIAIYLAIDYHGPSRIDLHPDIAFGFQCLRAKELIVQEYDGSGNLWATRGMIIYKLEKGAEAFTKYAHVPTGFSIFWLRNFTILRRLTIRPECVEMVVTEKGDICALSAGRLWYLPHNGTKFRETLKLSHYGFGDQGARNNGIIDINDSTVFFGEYFGNLNRDQVRVFKSDNYCRNWWAVFRFQPGQIRHIHAIQKDPYTDKLWILTGDTNEESIMAWSDDEFDSIEILGQGSQLWRICQLVFTEDDIYWGTDTYSQKVSGIYRYNKETSVLEKLATTEGAVFFATRLANGTIVMTTNREGIPNESDNRTRLFVIDKNNKIITFECGTWKHNRKGFWFKFAMLRLQRNQDGQSLAITCLNQKEFPDGELIIISENELLKAVKSR